MADNNKITNSNLLQVADGVGSFIEYWGFKKVHGKIWTLIFLSNQPVDANLLKDSLGISKALTSMSLKDLLHYNVIMEVEKDRPGTQKYTINPDITNVILDIINQREVVMLERIKGDFQKLTGDQKSQEGLDKNRVKELGQMVKSAHSLLKGMTSGSKVDFGLFDEVMKVSQ